MKKVLNILIFLAFFTLSTGNILGASFGYAPSTPASSATFGSDSTRVLRGQSTGGLKYVGADVGDRVDSIRFYVQGNGSDDSVKLILYSLIGNTVTQRKWMDTIGVTSSAGWHSAVISNGPVLIDGLDYAVGLAVFDDANVTVYWDGGGAGDGSNAAASAPNPFSETNNTNKYAIQVFYTPMTFSWGGSKLKHVDSIYATNLRDVPTTNDDSTNFGITGSFTYSTDAGSGTAVIDTRANLLRLVNDPRTGGYTQDSLRIYFYMTQGLTSESNDSVKIGYFILNKTWGEGTKDGARGTSGEATWDSAQVGTVAWTSQAGAHNAGDHGSEVALFWDNFNSWANDTTSFGGTDFLYYYITIPGASITSDFFSYGIVFWAVEQRNVTFITKTVGSTDDNTLGTTLVKPFIVGWESPPSSANSVLSGKIIDGISPITLGP